MAKQPLKPTEQQRRQPKWFRFAAIGISFCLGVALGKFAFTDQPVNAPNATAEEASDDVKEMRQGGYKYINPLLECDNYRPTKFAPVVLLESDIRSYIDQAIANESASIVSVYYRDLNNGPWLGINEQENYSPASLLKVPIMIAALKKAETEPGVLKRKILYEHPVDEYSQNILDTGMIVPGHYYTVEDLLFRMIKNSDNEAKNLLFQLVGDQMFTKVTNDLGLIIPGVATENYMSVKDYSSFFRVLYNATYLNKDMSEKGLEILSNTNFHDGIVAGVPKGVIVSHKFGERGYTDTNIKQLHDCGVVYANGNPYLLCIMTRGTDFTRQAKVIADISAMVWKSVNGTK